MSEHKLSRDSKLESLLNSKHIVTIEKLAVGGAGIARIQHNGKPVVAFVHRAAPQDVIEIEVTSVEKSFLRATITKIIEASPTRRASPCSYSEHCGGCHWQHITEVEQVYQKELILTELLKKFVPQLSFNLSPTVQGKNTFHYRNRIQLKQLQNQLGYFRHGTHDLIDIDSCLIADKKISEKIPSLKQSLKPSKDLVKYELKINLKNEFEHYKIGNEGEGLSFAQVNNEINDLLVQKTVQLVEQIQPDFLTELYAGAGNFTFPLLNQLKSLKIESVELNSQLTQHALKISLEKNMQKRLTVFTSDCESYVARRPLSQKLVLLDPPRAGTSEPILKKILSQNVENLVYISCQPTALARDLQYLTKQQNKFSIKHLQIFDMFPQTEHFETLVWLSTH